VPPPENTRHAAIAADYAHVTAPLRRLVDRYATEICLAVSAGTPVPAWVLEAMPALPTVMAETGRRASSFERECVDIVEASLLADRLGEEFDGVVVDVEDDTKELQRGQVVLRDPAVRARVSGPDLPLGDEVRVRLDEADVAERRVMFTLGVAAPDPGPGRADTTERGGRRSTAGRRSAAGTARRAAPPAPFALPSDGPAPAHGRMARARTQPGAEAVPDPAPRPQPSPSPGPRPTPRPMPQPRPRPEPTPGPGPSPQPEPSPRPEPSPDGPDTGVAAAQPLPHPGHGVGYPPMRRPVRPQVRDEVPLSEPWPRHAPAASHRRLSPLSEPVPTVRRDAFQDVYGTEYQAVASRELPMVVAADLLAVEGPGSDVYRF
jgi:hypothetical protein